jgi:hypothetical protein
VNSLNNTQPTQTRSFNNFYFFTDNSGRICRSICEQPRFRGQKRGRSSLGMFLSEVSRGIEATCASGLANGTFGRKRGQIFYRMGFKNLSNNE